MKWKVENALSRDVERQQLNKILAEIKAAISTATTQVQQQPVTNTINTVTRYAVARFTFTLEGDVTGSAVIDGTDNVTMTTTIADFGGAEEAPIDNQYYYRWNGEWRVATGVSPADGFGFVVQTDGGDYDLVSVVREIEVDTGELTITDGDGQAGNPTLGLADTAVTPGSYTNANIDVDQFGRVTFAEDGTGGAGGVLPMVTGDVPPELVYLEDGSLVYFEV